MLCLRKANGVVKLNLFCVVRGFKQGRSQKRDSIVSVNKVCCFQAKSSQPF